MREANDAEGGVEEVLARLMLGGQIAEIIERWCEQEHQYGTDKHYITLREAADQILALISREIEGVENPYQWDDFDYEKDRWQAFNDCRQAILEKLK